MKSKHTLFLEITLTVKIKSPNNSNYNSINCKIITKQYRASLNRKKINSVSSEKVLQDVLF